MAFLMNGKMRVGSGVYSRTIRMSRGVAALEINLSSTKRSYETVMET